MIFIVAFASLLLGGLVNYALGRVFGPIGALIGLGGTILCLRCIK